MPDNTYDTCENCLYWDTLGLCSNPESMRFNRDVLANAIACDSFKKFEIVDFCAECQIDQTK